MITRAHWAVSTQQLLMLTAPQWRVIHTATATELTTIIHTSQKQSSKINMNYFLQLFKSVHLFFYRSAD